MTVDVDRLHQLIDAERARVVHTFLLVKTLDGGALMQLAAARQDALAQVGIQSLALQRRLAAHVGTLPPELAGAVTRLQGAAAQLVADNQRLMPLLRQALSLLTSYTAGLNGVPAIYNKRGLAPHSGAARARHSSRA